MLKLAAKTRRRTKSSVTAEITAIALGCALVAGGVSAAEIGMLENSRADAPVSVEVMS